MSKPLVLSLFPGIGLLDMAFEEAGFCVVRGPDLLWGGDVRRFHPPAGRFDGVIGGPPCQVHSGMADLNPLAGRKHGDMIPEFERVVSEAEPEWFVMENVQAAPTARVLGYSVDCVRVDNRSLGEEQQRKRQFSFGAIDGQRISPHVAAAMMGVAENPRRALVVLAGHGPAAGQRVRGIEGRTWQQGARLQGLSDRTWQRPPPDGPRDRQRRPCRHVPRLEGRCRMTTPTPSLPASIREALDEYGDAMFSYGDGHESIADHATRCTAARTPPEDTTPHG